MRLDHLRLTGLALLFFLPFIGAVHLFDWDEINFAECAREMLLTGDFAHPQIDFKPFWEKPPLFLWMQALSMKMFGIGEFAARFPNVLCGIATLLFVYHLGRRLHDRAFGWLWALSWLGSLLPHLYFRSGIIDPWFNLLIFSGLYGFIAFRWQFFTAHEGKSFWQRYRYLLIGGWLIGLAILTKGPVAYLIVLLTLGLYWGRYRFRNKGFFKHLILFSLAAFSVSLLWFGIETIQHGTWFVREFIAYQIRLLTTPDSGHSGFWGFHAAVLLIGCFPVSVFAIPNLWGDHQTEDELLESDTLAGCKQSDLTTWMQLLFWVVFALFSLVQTKIVHYSSLAYFPLTYLGTLTIWRAMRWKFQPRKIGILLLVFGFLIGLTESALPIIGNHLSWISAMTTADSFLNAQMRLDIPWHWWQGIPGIVLIIASITAWSYWRKAEPWKTAQTIFAGGAVFITFSLLTCVGSLERYSQYGMIEFYESKIGENCQIKPIGFKTYAHLFYTRKSPACDLEPAGGFAGPAANDSGRKTYLVAKISNLQEVAEWPGCRELYRNGGYVFFEHMPTK